MVHPYPVLRLAGAWWSLEMMLHRNLIGNARQIVRDSVRDSVPEP